MYQELEEIPLFDGIKVSDLKKISSLVTHKKVKRNQLIIRQGDVCQYFYIIKKGQAKITITRDPDHEVILAFLSEGEFFGELSLLDEDICSANVYAQQACELMCIKSENFKKLLKTVPELSYRLLYHMAQRIRYSDRCIHNLNIKNSTRRIGIVLLHLAEQSGYRYKDSVIIKKIPFQQDIASLAGTSRETVSRSFSRLQDHAYIQKNGRHLVINDYKRFYREFSS